MLPVNRYVRTFDRLKKKVISAKNENPELKAAVDEVSFMPSSQNKLIGNADRQGPRPGSISRHLNAEW